MKTSIVELQIGDIIYDSSRDRYGNIIEIVCNGLLSYSENSYITIEWENNKNSVYHYKDMENIEVVDV